MNFLPVFSGCRVVETEVCKHKQSTSTRIVADIPEEKWYKRVINFLLRKKNPSVVIRCWGNLATVASTFKPGNTISVMGNLSTFTGRVKLPDGEFLNDPNTGEPLLILKSELIAQRLIKH